MNNAILVDIFKSKDIVIPGYAFKNYSKLGLEAEEFLFLMYLYNLGNSCIFDPNMFTTVMNTTLDNVMNKIESLTEKGLIKVVALKNDKNLMEEVVVLDGFYDKLSLLVMDSVNEVELKDTNIFELIEKEFARTLSPMEYEIIKAWLANNMSEEIIKEAIKEATLSGVSNLRYIDKILYEWVKVGVKTAADVEKLRLKRKKQASKDNEVDLDIMDWNWFDED